MEVSRPSVRSPEVNHKNLHTQAEEVSAHTPQNHRRDFNVHSSEEDKKGRMNTNRKWYLFISASIS